MRPDRPTRVQAAGFTLVELIVVIVIGSVLAATLVVFFKPAIDTYIASRARADLADQADTALRRMARDVRLAVPNSVRNPNAQCFELVPTSTGGRFRTGPDTLNDSGPSCTPGATCAAPLDTSQATTMFDVLTPLSATPAIGDWVVVGNQTPADVYGGASSTQITSAVVAPPVAAFGRHRITVASKQFPSGYDGGRFSVVPNAQRAVFYVCSGAGTDASGNGTGTLYRLQNYGFNAAYPSACPSIAAGDVLATRVRSCNFVYDPNQGATQQSGFVWLELDLTRNNETAHLAMGAHVANGP